MSDIHLSNDNIQEFQLHYRDSLLKELDKKNKEKPIDVILISGDLVDRGGKSLLKISGYEDESNPYNVFDKEFIVPICEKLYFLRENIIFIPGNHDVDRDKIGKITEPGLKNLIDGVDKANKLYQYLKDDKCPEPIRRLHFYEDYENKFHEDNILKYNKTKFESTFIFTYKGDKVGFALINDSWRCSNDLKTENHFFGTNQILTCLNRFRDEETCFNFLVIHHTLENFNHKERERIKDIVNNKNIDIIIEGHVHSNRVDLMESNRKVLIVRGRSAFDNPNENHSEYQPGYNVIDLDFDNKKVEVKLLKYNGRFKFIADEEKIEKGIFKYEMNKINLSDLEEVTFVKNI